MATFLVLPSRERLEHQVTEFARTLLPGFSPPAGLWERLIRDLVSPEEARQTEPFFIVHREDFLDEGSLVESLRSGFGAEPGDEIREIESGRTRRWIVPPIPATAPAR